jgi:TolA-binding protein
VSDPTRLLEGANELERALLRTWEHEQPSEAARARVLALVAGGVGVGAGSAIKTGAPASKALLFWLAAGALGAAAVGTAYWATHRTNLQPPAPHAIAPPLAASEARMVAPVASATAATPVVATAERAVAPVARAPQRSALTSSPPAHPATLGEEVTELDRARRALADGDPAAALRRVEAYQARFPRGALTEEAEAVGVEALVATGDVVSARRAAGRFFAAHPDSPHGARVRALLRAAPSP